jgi:hypothetical protein
VVNGWNSGQEGTGRRSAEETSQQFPRPIAYLVETTHRAYPGEHGAETRSLLADLAVGAHGRLLSEVRFDLVHIWEMSAATMACG